MTFYFICVGINIAIAIIATAVSIPICKKDGGWVSIIVYCVLTLVPVVGGLFILVELVSVIRR